MMQYTDIHVKLRCEKLFVYLSRISYTVKICDKLNNCRDVPRFRRAVDKQRAFKSPKLSDL